MISYNEDNTFMPWAVDAFKQAQRIVVAIPDQNLELRCHEVARVVRDVLRHPRFGVVDGVYVGDGPGVDHSWLVASGATRMARLAILDVYAVGRLPQVQLVAGDMGLASMYRAGPARSDIDDALVERLVGKIWV